LTFLLFLDTIFRQVSVPRCAETTQNEESEDDNDAFGGVEDSVVVAALAD
jgi:hypothetical protein